MIVARDKQKSAMSQFLSRPISSIHPSPENIALYGPIQRDKPDFKALGASIKRDGIREPLVITQDGYIVSGHRRFAAAVAVGLKRVPCRVMNYRRVDDHDRHVRELREHNRQRVKTRDEQLREAVIDVNAVEAHDRLIKHRKARSRVSSAPLEIGDSRKRARISAAKTPFLKAVTDVIAARREFWPLSDRAIHYALLNKPPLIHASKPSSRYTNNQKSYKSLVELLTRARRAGLIDWRAITDTTRPVTKWGVWQNPAEYVRKELEELFDGFWRDLMQSQPNHIELVVEKLTVSSIIESVAGDFTIPMTVGRGYSSLPPRYEMAQRFKKSGKSILIVIFVTDHDPDGEGIAESFARSMRDDFGISQIHPIKAALTAEQVAKHNLPPLLKAKRSSSRYESFASKHGDDVFELEAIAPGVLQQIVREAIESVIDSKAYNNEQRQEREDARFLAARRTVATQAITGEFEREDKKSE